MSVPFKSGNKIPFFVHEDTNCQQALASSELRVEGISKKEQDTCVNIQEKQQNGNNLKALSLRWQKAPLGDGLLLCHHVDILMRFWQRWWISSGRSRKESRERESEEGGEDGREYL